MVKCGLWLLDPFTSITVPAPATICGHGVFTVGEIKRIFGRLNGRNALVQRDCAVLAILYGAGLRLGEALSLDVQDYDPVDRVVWVRHGKGNSSRVLPLGKQACRDIDRYLADARPLMVSAQSGSALYLTCFGKRLGPAGFRARFRRIQEEAGVIPSHPPHAIRHSFSTHMLQRGADVRLLQRLLGHVRLDTTARYTQVDLADLRRTLNRAHPREGGRS